MDLNDQAIFQVPFHANLINGPLHYFAGSIRYFSLVCSLLFICWRLLIRARSALVCSLLTPLSKEQIKVSLHHSRHFFSLIHCLSWNIEKIECRDKLLSFPLQSQVIREDNQGETCNLSSTKRISNSFLN